MAAAVALWRIRAIIPCHNRPADLSRLLSDLAALDRGPAGRVALSVLVVDNASDRPIAAEVPEGLAVEVLRLERNAGGSGGFNAGMGQVLARGVPGDATELLWLLDSDVRVEPGALLPLLEALERDQGLAAVGSALVDPQSGAVFEVGGRVNPRTGEYDQPVPAGAEQERLVEAEYLAACSLLVRRAVAEQTGPMADLFLNGDDVEWCLRMRRRTGLRLAVAPASRVKHPHPDRMRTGARYYAARNAFAALEAAGCGAATRLARAGREVGRAIAQTLVGRDDLARLHLAGLADAVAGRRGPAPAGTISFEAWRALDELSGALRQVLAVNPPRGRVLIRRGLLPDLPAVQRSLNAVCVEPVVMPEEQVGAWRALGGTLARLVMGPPWGVAVVSARARPGDWLAGSAMVTACPEGFVLRRISRVERALKLAYVAARGGWLSARLALRRPATPRPESGVWATRRLSLSVIILSHNRWSTLARTLATLEADPALAGAEVIVVDNASDDGTPARLRERFPRVRIIALQENKGAGAFNDGAAAALGEALLILDDDAAPAEGVLERALDLLSRRPDLGAVALHPRHPETRRSEWPFGEGRAPCDDWPVMGCGNLIRRDAWRRAGGYEPGFFLYRNDADLAMTLLEAGWGVHFDPSLVVWHDSPAAAAKSLRWFEMATRNWVWLCRRHGRGLSALLVIVLGWLHTHWLAGREIRAHLATLRGIWRGVMKRPPRLPPGVRDDGMPLRRLLRLRLGW